MIVKKSLGLTVGVATRLVALVAGEGSIRGFDALLSPLRDSWEMYKESWSYGAHGPQSRTSRLMALISAIITLFAVFWAPTAAPAQEEFTRSLTNEWSPSSEASIRPAFTLLATAGPTRLFALGLHDESIAEVGDNHTETTRGNEEDRGYFLSLSQAPATAAFAPLKLDRPIASPIFSLHPLETLYEQWVSRLADTRTPMEVRGGSVLPFFQINLPSASLPIGLYVSPLLGDTVDAR